MGYINPALPHLGFPRLFLHSEIFPLLNADIETLRDLQAQDAWYLQTRECCWVFGPSYRHWYLRGLWWHPIRVSMLRLQLYGNGNLLFSCPNLGSIIMLSTSIRAIHYYLGT